MGDDYSNSTRTILTLFFFLVALVILLFLLYKKMNKEAEGEYTIQHMVNKEGGIRDQVRAAAIALRTRLGVWLCPNSDSIEEREEMQELRDEEGQVEEGQVEEGQVEEGDSQGIDSEGSSQEEEKEDEDDNEEQGKGDDTSHDTSSSEGLKAGEQTRQTEPPAANVEMEVKGKEQKEEEEESRGGLLINLQQFSGSAIWYEEEGIEREVTSL